MWGNISTEATFQTNFNMGFSNTTSEILIHLSLWQYWWWFWFVLVWSLYFFLIIRVIRFRTLKFKPKIVSSLRSHGKWGDLIICLIPLSWCCNILINSGFLLKLIEWQSESCLFTIRIRGRQWYWVYKFDVKDFSDILTAQKIVGTNKFVFPASGGYKNLNKYVDIVHLRASKKWLDLYWENNLYKQSKFDNFTYTSNNNDNSAFISSIKSELTEISNNELFNDTDVAVQNIIDSCYNITDTTSFFNFCRNESNLNFGVSYDSPEWDMNDITTFDFLYKNCCEVVDDVIDSDDSNITSTMSQKAITVAKPVDLGVASTKFFKKLISYSFESYGDVDLNKPQSMNFDTIFNCLFKPIDFIEKTVNNFKYFSSYVVDNQYKSNIVFFNDFDESLRWAKRSFGVIAPLRVIKLPIDNNILNNISTYVDIIRFRFNTQNTIKHKPVSNNFHYIFKQKRYNSRNTVEEFKRYFRDSKGNPTTNIRSKIKPFLVNNSIFTNEIKQDLAQTLRLYRKNKNHGEIFPVTLYRRLLRTRRTLVLPVHINVAAITSSYDVVHSWFIPGLGLKLDCIPGRATHHTIYIDNAGFYYGQCAEICGRYHHHMPIKVCALPFEHFILWWQSFGLTKLTFTNTQKKYNNYYNFRKFVW